MINSGMNIRDIISEGLSPILYHRTGLQKFLNITNSDEFRLSPDIGTDSEVMMRLGQNIPKSFKVGSKVTYTSRYGDVYNGVITNLDDPYWPEITLDDGYTQTVPAKDLKFKLDPNLNKKKKKKLYYMSTSRSKTGAYNRASEHTSSQAMLVLDGKKLMADGYTGNPINYWAGFTTTDNEMEDRIYSDKKSIPDFSKYVLAVHLLVSNIDDSKQLNNNTRAARQIKLWGKRNDIPVYLYSDFENYNALNKKTDKISYRSSPRPRDQAPYIPRSKFSKNAPSYARPFDALIELLNVSDRSKLSSDAIKKLGDMSYSDYLRGLKSDIHNARQSSDRNELDNFISQLKKKNIYSLKDFVSYINNKFSS